MTHILRSKSGGCRGEAPYLDRENDILLSTGVAVGLKRAVAASPHDNLGSSSVLNDGRGGNIVQLNLFPDVLYKKR